MIDELGGNDIEDVGVDRPAQARVVGIVDHAVLHEQHGCGKSSVVVFAVADLLTEALECLRRVVELSLVVAFLV